MLEQQRKTEIMSRLRKEGFVSVADLMKQLQASRSSVMRDLIDLEESGLLERTRGGAALKSRTAVLTFGTELPTQEKRDLHAKQKQKIAAKTAALIPDHSTVYLDSGTTTVYLLPHLSDKDVTIITPSMYLLRHLPAEFNGTIYLLGGMYNRKYDMNFGSVTSREAGEYRYDTAVISASAIQMETGEVMGADPDVTAIKQIAMARAGKKILAADSSKYSASAVITFAQLSDFDEIVTELEEAEGEENEYEDCRPKKESAD